MSAAEQAVDQAVDRRADARLWLQEFFPAATGQTGGCVRVGMDPASWTELRGFRADLFPMNRISGGDQSVFLDLLAETLVTLAADGHDVFVCPYLHRPRGRAKGEALSRRHAHADIDGPVDLDLVRSVGGFIVASGSLADDGSPQGHVYVRLSGEVTAAEHEALCLALGQEVGGDHHDRSKIADNDVLRPPGTLNHKTTPPRPVTWLVRPDDEQVRTWSPADLAEWLGVGWPVTEPDSDAGGADDGTPGQPTADSRRPGGESAYERVLQALANHGREVRRRGGRRAQARCPGPNHVNGDRNPSLSVGVGRRGAVVKCFGDPGCTTEEIATALGLPVAALFEDWVDGPDIEVGGDRAGDTSSVRPGQGANTPDTLSDDGKPIVSPEPKACGHGDFVYSRNCPGCISAGRAAEHRANALEQAALDPEPVIFTDLLADADDEIEHDSVTPTLLPLAEGALFYEGKHNTLLGKRESGKTWLALLAGLLAATREVDPLPLVILDLDRNGGRAGMWDRMEALGMPRDLLPRSAVIRYRRVGSVRQLDEAVRLILADYPGAVTVIDTISRLYGLLGLNLNRPEDWNPIQNDVIGPQLDAGGTVVSTDHLAGSISSQADGGTGAKDRANAADGAIIRVTNVRRFSRERGGESWLTVLRDRFGKLPAEPHSGAAFGDLSAGRFELVPGGGYRIDQDVPAGWSFDKETGRVTEVSIAGDTDGKARQRGASDLTPGAKKVLDCLNKNAEPLSRGRIEKITGQSSDRVSRSLTELRNLGLARSVDSGPATRWEAS